MVHVRLASLVAAITLAMTPLVTQSASAQGWNHGDYVSSVNSLAGNYLYSAGSSGGTVEADFPPSGQTVSVCDVSFTVAWTNAGPPPWNGTISYKGDVTGSAGSGSTAESQLHSGDQQGGTITKNTTNNGNPYNFTGLTFLTFSLTTNSWQAKIDTYAKVVKGTGTSGTATSFVYTIMN